MARMVSVLDERRIPYTSSGIVQVWPTHLAHMLCSSTLPCLTRKSFLCGPLYILD
jgi:hypothetical protein